MRAALRHLRTIDPVLAGIIEQVGPYGLISRPERFQGLVRAIIFQQLAGRAAQAIYQRFVALFPGVRFPSPARVLAADDAAMRAAGLSRQKLIYIRDLATHVVNGAIKFARFERMDDEEIIVELTRVQGIGRWTAEMFLMFNLGRPDVWPVDDLGVRNAVFKAYGLATPPSPRELREIGERWRPYRTVAVWYLWQSTRIVTPNVISTPLRSALSRRRAKAQPV
ncbi:MAG: DNA-3-methyladenine glycosylase 2 family protein [Candidatus Binataceae bacterium]|nr:DNA-3-methyladenine glycosylase 2 family protein [Candidatus Binataceae bacterium]